MNGPLYVMCCIVLKYLGTKVLYQLRYYSYLPKYDKPLFIVYLFPSGRYFYITYTDLLKFIKWPKRSGKTLTYFFDNTLMFLTIFGLMLERNFVYQYDKVFKEEKFFWDSFMVFNIYTLLVTTKDFLNHSNLLYSI